MKQLATPIVMATLGLQITCVVAQEFPRPEAVTFLGIEQAAKLLKKSVFAVQIEANKQDQNKGSPWILLGSGFFVNGTNNFVLGITCNHVVAAPLTAKREVFVGIETEKGYVRSPCRIALQDPTNDIAILLPQRRADQQALGFQNMVFPDSMFDDNTLLVEGCGVIIPGYPLALGNEDDKNNPVIRIGIVAQFTGKNYFLIDGIASHGNSGSPVFAVAPKNPKLAGMVTSHVADRIQLLDENRQLAAQLPYNSGLARAVTMKVIQEALQRASGQY